MSIIDIVSSFKKDVHFVMKEYISYFSDDGYVFEEEAFLVARGAVLEIEKTRDRPEFVVCSECYDVLEGAFAVFQHVDGTYRIKMLVVGTPIEAVVVETAVNHAFVVRRVGELQYEGVFAVVGGVFEVRTETETIDVIPKI